MEKIGEMIERLCPEGVGNIKLEDVVNILDSQRKPVSKDSRIAGVYPYYGANGIQDYVDDYIFDGTYILLGEDGSVINEDKSPILHWVSGKIWVNNHAHILENKGNANLRYIYYALSETDVSDIVRGTPPKLNQANLRSIEIPLPPLSIQQEIVRILDSFTSMITNLETELASRQKQYEYYRNKLLTFDENDDSVEWKTFGSLASSYSGLSGKSKVDFVDGNAKFIPYMNIFANPATSLAITEKVKVLESEKQNQIKYGDMFFTTSSETPDECGMSSVLCAEIDEPIYLNSFCFGMRFHDLSNKEPRYFKHLLRCTHIRKEISKAANGVTRFNISKKVFEKILIPIPTLQRQQEIVSTLDTFESLITNIKQELEARKKQYEYYREQLLTFE